MLHRKELELKNSSDRKILEKKLREIRDFHFGSNLQKKVANHFPESLLFRWVDSAQGSQSEKNSENMQPLKSKRKTPKLWLKSGKGRLLNEKRVKPERKSTKIAAVLLLFCFWAKTVGKCGKKSSNRINLSSFPDMICAPCPQESRSHAYIHHCVRNRPE